MKPVARRKGKESKTANTRRSTKSVSPGKIGCFCQRKLLMTKIKRKEKLKVKWIVMMTLKMMMIKLTILNFKHSVFNWWENFVYPALKLHEKMFTQPFYVRKFLLPKPLKYKKE